MKSSRFKLSGKLHNLIIFNSVWTAKESPEQNNENDKQKEVDYRAYLYVLASQPNAAFPRTPCVR
jgi:hypothetical protein